MDGLKKIERQRDGGKERWRDGEMERKRDGEKERMREGETKCHSGLVSHSLRLSFPLSLHLSFPPSLHLSFPLSFPGWRNELRPPNGLARTAVFMASVIAFF